MATISISYDNQTFCQLTRNDIPPETSVSKYQSTPRSIVDEWSFSAQCGESVNSGDNETVSAMVRRTPSETLKFSSKTLSNSLVRLGSEIFILYLFYVHRFHVVQCLPKIYQFIPKEVHPARIWAPRNTQPCQKSCSFSATKEIPSLSQIIAVISVLSINYRDNKCLFTCDTAGTQWRTV